MIQKESLLRDTIIILSASVIIGLGFNALQEKGIALVREPEKFADDSLLFAPSTPATPTQSATATTDTLPPATANQSTAEQQPLSPKEITEKIPAQPPSAPVASAQPAAPSKLQTQTPDDKSDSHSGKSVNFSQVKKLLNDPDVLFIDARKAEEFAAGKIGNAINIYTPDFDNHIGEIIGLPRDKRIIVYCGGGSCDLSHDLADKLAIFGFTRVFVYTGGWTEWESKK